MYNGVGLQTTRGSGTNGRTQSNKFLAKPNCTYEIAGGSSRSSESDRGATSAAEMRKREKEMSEHDRKLLVLEEKLVDQGSTDAEIAAKLDEARQSLLQRN